MAAKDDTKPQDDATGTESALRSGISEEERHLGFAARLAEGVPHSRRLERADLPLEFEAELVRGLGWHISYSPHRLSFLHGQRVRINREELDHLQATAVDRVTFRDVGPDGVGHVRRHLPKFKYFDAASGEEIPAVVPEDTPAARPEGDAFDQAMRRRASRHLAAGAGA